MEDACADVAVEAFQGRIHHARRYFPRKLARENIACDIDEVLQGACSSHFQHMLTLKKS